MCDDQNLWNSALPLLRKQDYFSTTSSVYVVLLHVRLGDSGTRQDSRVTIRGSTAAATVVVHPPPLKPAIMMCSLAGVARNCSILQSFLTCSLRSFACSVRAVTWVSFKIGSETKDRDHAHRNLVTAPKECRNKHWSQQRRAISFSSFGQAT